MDFDHLRYVVEVAERGSITKAAQYLYISQPYLSRIIKGIEQELNIALFVRTPQGINLTSQGKEFIQKAKKILTQYDSLHEIKTIENKEKPIFNITSVRSSLVMETFLELIGEYKDYEAYEFTFKETDGQMPIHDVTYYEADLGVIYTRDQVKSELLKKLDRQKIAYETICEFKTCVILGVNHPILQSAQPITIENLAPYGMVLYEEQALPYVQDYFPSDLIEEMPFVELISKNIYVNNRAALHNILFHTNCFSFGTQASRNQEEMFDITSVPLEETQHSTALEMGVIYRKNIDLPLMAKQFIEKLKQHYSMI
ncbi:MAG TPA: LysR family transcriptional regulator [Virgibacillus sp.]|nr:LysR family transcriptional regulator [Virgibacillus sp.]